MKLEFCCYVHFHCEPQIVFYLEENKGERLGQGRITENRRQIHYTYWTLKEK